MANHVRRVEEVEARLERVKGEGAQKEDLKKLRADSKKSYVGPRPFTLFPSLLC